MSARRNVRIGASAGSRAASAGKKRMTDKEAILEKLAALEHEQWAHWTICFFKEMSPAAILRWKKQCRTPYDKLSEREKESDRKWARKVLAIIDDKNSELTGTRIARTY